MYEVLYLPLLADEMIEIDPEMVNQTVDEAFVVQIAERVAFLWNLTELTSYAVFVRALNINGAGPYAEKVVVMTLEDESVSETSARDNTGVTISTGQCSCLIREG